MITRVGTAWPFHLTAWQELRVAFSSTYNRRSTKPSLQELWAAVHSVLKEEAVHTKAVHNRSPWQGFSLSGLGFELSTPHPVYTVRREKVPYHRQCSLVSGLFLVQCVYTSPPICTVSAQPIGVLLPKRDISAALLAGSLLTTVPRVALSCTSPYLALKPVAVPSAPIEP